MSQILTAAQTKVGQSAQQGARTAALAVALFGGLFVYGIGFAGAEVLHNAAHDVRHANNFPCH